MKEQIRLLVEQCRFDDITELAARKKRILGSLLSLTFDREPLIAWRSVEAMGIAADGIAEDDPDYVLGHLRRLHWLLNEEAGGVCLFAPPAMAEIIRRRAEMFADFIPLVLSLLVTMEEEDLDHFLPGILWAIGRLAPAAGEDIASVLPAVVAALDSSQSQVRGLAAWCLGKADKKEILAARTDLLNDEGAVEIYMDGNFKRTHVGRLLREILSSES